MLDTIGKRADMKIVFFVEIYLPVLNGVVVSVQTYRRALEDMGHEVFIVAPGFPNVAQEKNVLRLYSVRYPSKTDYRLTFPYPSAHFEALERMKPDIVHTHSPFFMGAYARKMSRKLRAPFVFTFHTQYWEYAHYVPLPQAPVRRAAVKWSKNFCNSCDGIVSPSQRIKDVLQSMDVRPPVRVLPTGIFPDEIKNASDSGALSRYGIPCDKTLLVTAGRLAREKNFLFLMTALAPLLKENPEYHLVFIGGGPEEETLKTQCQSLELSSRVSFAGHIPKLEVLKLMHHGKLFVFASKTETQGLVILEAMGAGLPVVALRATGVDEVVEDGAEGFLCEESEREFCEKAGAVLSNNEMREAMRSAAQKKAENFSAPVLAKNLLSFYRELQEKRK